MPLVHDPALSLTENVRNFLYQLRDESQYGTNTIFCNVPTLVDKRGQKYAIQSIRNAVSNIATEEQFNGYLISLRRNPIHRIFELSFREVEPYSGSRVPRPTTTALPDTNEAKIGKLAFAMYEELRANPGKFMFVPGNDGYAPKMLVLTEVLFSRNGTPLTKVGYSMLCTKIENVLNAKSHIKHALCWSNVNRETGERRLYVKIVRPLEVAFPPPTPEIAPEVQAMRDKYANMTEEDKEADRLAREEELEAQAEFERIQASEAAAYARAGK